jgi:hypothetical protein
MIELIRAIFDSWNQFRLTRKSKRSAQLTFQQLSEFYDYIQSTKTISDNRATADDGAGEIRVARSVPESTAFNQ